MHSARTGNSIKNSCNPPRNLTESSLMKPWNYETLVESVEDFEYLRASIVSTIQGKAKVCDSGWHILHFPQDALCSLYFFFDLEVWIGCLRIAFIFFVHFYNKYCRNYYHIQSIEIEVKKSYLQAKVGYWVQNNESWVGMGKWFALVLFARSGEKVLLRS